MTDRQLSQNAVIAAIEGLPPEWARKGSMAQFNTITIADAIAAVTALPDAWRPIEDDFPHSPVLLSRPDGDGQRYTPTTGFNDATGVWRVFRSEGGMEPLPFVPTHFMPLPSPPEANDGQ